MDSSGQWDQRDDGSGMLVGILPVESRVNLDRFEGEVSRRDVSGAGERECRREV